MDESKYTKIPNELLEAILEYRFTASQLVALLYIIRKTYGWGKHIDQISVLKMAKDTGRHRSTMMYAINDLVKLNVISIEKEGGGKPNSMRILDPKDWDRPVQWSGHVVPSGHVQRSGQGGVQYSGQGGVQWVGQVGDQWSGHTKEKKENIKKYKESKKSNRKKGFNDFEQREDNDYDRIEEILSRRPIESEEVSREEFQEQKKEYFTSAIADLLGGKLREEN